MKRKLFSSMLPALGPGGGKGEIEVHDPFEPSGRREPARNRLARLVESPWFNLPIMGVIIANAVVIGLDTYPSISENHGDTLELLNDVFLYMFCAELALRIASYRRPLEYLRDPWNVFDLVTVLASFAPGLRGNATILRLARLLRVVRVIRILPDLRVLILAVGRSLPPLFSMSILTTALLFVYGMVGWLLFHEEAPAHWGNIGRAMLTLFVLLTLENFPAYLEEGMAIEPVSVLFFISFVLIAAFVILNVLIGIIINSMDEARKIHLADEARAETAAGRVEHAEEVVEETLAELREAIAKLEVALQAEKT